MQICPAALLSNETVGQSYLCKMMEQEQGYGTICFLVAKGMLMWPATVPPLLAGCLHVGSKGNISAGSHRLLALVEHLEASLYLQITTGRWSGICSWYGLLHCVRPRIVLWPGQCDAVMGPASEQDHPTLAWTQQQPLMHASVLKVIPLSEQFMLVCSACVRAARFQFPQDKRNGDDGQLAMVASSAQLTRKPYKKDQFAVLTIIPRSNILRRNFVFVDVCNGAEVVCRIDRSKRRSHWNRFRNRGC